MSVNSKMTAIADKIRSLLGISGAMGLDAMSTNLGMAVNECDTQADLIQQLKEGVADVEEDLVRTNVEIGTQSSIIQQIKTALEGKAAGGGGVFAPYTIYPAAEAPQQAVTGDFWVDYSSEIQGGLPNVIVAGNTPVFQDDTTTTRTSTTAAQMGSGCRIYKNGTYRIKAKAYRTNTSGTWTLQVYKNGTAVSGATATWSGNTGTLSADVSCNANDIITLRGASRGTNYTLTLFGFTVCANYDNGFEVA